MGHTVAVLYGQASIPSILREHTTRPFGTHLLSTPSQHRARDCHVYTALLSPTLFGVGFCQQVDAPCSTATWWT